MADEKTMCTQCGERPAMFVYEGGHELCADCNAKVMAAQRDQQAMLVQASAERARMINYLHGMMESSTGLTGLYPRIQVPEPPPIVQTGDVTLHNINIDNSVVGSVNTGTIHELDVSLTDIRNSGAQELVDAIRLFTETALSPTTSIDDAERRQIVEEMAFLSEEARRPPQDRKTGMAEMVMDRLRDTASTVNTLAVAWGHLEPMLREVFS